jgi:hypothetical protein
MTTEKITSTVRVIHPAPDRFISTYVSGICAKAKRISGAEKFLMRNEI